MTRKRRREPLPDVLEIWGITWTQTPRRPG
jgi:hypothetical protein